MSLRRFLPDAFTIYLVLTVLLASFLPVSGQGAVAMKWVTNIGIALLFFFHGAKLSRDAAVAGLMHWRLHLLIFSCTFVMFPLLGLALRPALNWWLPNDLVLGILFLCALPATVQSAIAFTSIARGNVPAAICSASGSSLIGIFITPILVPLLLTTSGQIGISWEGVVKIMTQLLLPFLLGQYARRWIGKWMTQRKSLVRVVDQGSILLVVYTAFSEAVVGGIWGQLSWELLLKLVLALCVLLALSMTLSRFLSRRLGFDVEDEIAVLFCGSKKSLATGVPMANVLLPSAAIGMAVLPLMIFHQIQLMVSGVLAQRYARRLERREKTMAESTA